MTYFVKTKTLNSYTITQFFMDIINLIVLKLLNNSFYLIKYDTSLVIDYICTQENYYCYKKLSTHGESRCALSVISLVF